MQGYFFSKPVTADAIVDMLEAYAMELVLAA
jgi:EAL domain-containing protein (putative c-di-GMP-specific phosphodiesterase class I)